MTSDQSSVTAELEPEIINGAAAPEAAIKTMVFASIFIAMFLDPIRFVLAFLGALIIKAWWHCFLIAPFIALIMEAILDATHTTREWGTDLAVSYLVSSLHVLTSYYIIKAMRKRGLM